MDRAGRLLPFDRARLRASLARVLPDGGVRAEDLASVLAAWLGRPEQSPVLGVDDLSTLVERVLAAAGDEPGAQAYRALRRSRRWRPECSPCDLEELPGPAGPAAEHRLAQRVLADRVVSAWLPDAVARAERAGWLSLGPHLGGARLPAATLPPGWSTEHRGPELGATLRRLLGLVSDELVLPWTGALPSRSEWLDLLRHLDGAARGRLVVALSVSEGPSRRSLARLVDAIAERAGTPVALRLLAPRVEPVLALCAGLPAAVEWARCAPEPGLVRGSAVLDLAALARDRRADGTGRVLALAEELAGLALGALDSLTRAGFGEAAGHALAAQAGESRRWRLVLAGHAAVAGDLLARHEPELGADLQAALGDRLARARTQHGAGLPHVELGLLSPAAPVHDLAAETARRARLGITASEPMLLPAAVAVAETPPSPSSRSGPRPCA